jgi:hypothetical protein
MTIWVFGGRWSGWGRCKKNFKKYLFSARMWGETTEDMESTEEEER